MTYVTGQARLSVDFKGGSTVPGGMPDYWRFRAGALSHLILRQGQIYQSLHAEGGAANRNAEDRCWLYRLMEKSEPFFFRLPEAASGLPSNTDLWNQVLLIVDHYNNSPTLSFGLMLTLDNPGDAPSCVSYERRGNRLVIQYNYDFREGDQIPFYVNPTTGDVFADATTGTVLINLTYAYRLIVEFERMPPC